jgi:transposase
MKNAVFATDLTDERSRVARPHRPKPSKRGRPRTDLHHIFDALFYLVKTGVQWRNLPRNFPPWQTVHHVFGRWAEDMVDPQRPSPCGRAQRRRQGLPPLGRHPRQPER